MRLAIIDDYQGFALANNRWAEFPDVSVVPFRDHVYDEDELARRLADFDAVMRIRERTEFRRSLLERLPRLKLILATGMRNAVSLDLAYTDERGITVCATDAHHQSTVEVVWALILGLFRRIPQEVGSLRAGGWQIGLGRELAGRTLGILGFGNMGTPVARIGQLFGMKVIAWSPNLTSARTDPLGVRCVSKQELFAQSDVISLHMPLGPTSRGIVGAAEIAAMKADAFLINTSRAPLVDIEALTAALREERIGGYGVDVYDVEPLPANHPFRSLPNVYATPHIGFVTQENYELFYAETVENLRAYLAGSPIRRITAESPFLPESQVGLERGVKGYVPLAAAS